MTPAHLEGRSGRDALQAVAAGKEQGLEAGTPPRVAVKWLLDTFPKLDTKQASTRGTQVTVEKQGHRAPGMLSTP